ncbi:MAG: helix-turn-helix domain-containing protein [Clostridia bacterium]|nr:helix-turn-helix domain-containing protein [Clostridia bacterium]NCC44262.1 helix-turn-helix domain-containing protein [Clostridia bacterium]
METISEHIKSIRQETGMNQREFAEHFHIPVRTIEDWEYGKRTPPEYVVRLLKYRVLFEKIDAIGNKEAEFVVLSEKYIAKMFVLTYPNSFRNVRFVKDCGKAKML